MIGGIDAMVIVALARAGKKETAEKSLDQLTARNRSHPLLASLRKLVDEGEDVDAILAAEPLKDFESWSWQFITTERMVRTLHRDLTER